MNEKPPLIKRLLRRAFLTSFLMGFSSGVPLLVLPSLVQGYAKDAGIDISIIGALTIVTLPYSLKFLWSFWLDYLTPPFLGRRRGWIVIAQAALMAGLWILSYVDPRDIMLLASVNFFICFAAATQDVVVDAYRREDLCDDELAFGSACYVWGYRLGMAAVSGGGLFLADSVGWPWVFRGVALLMFLGPLTILFSPEPSFEKPATRAGLREIVYVPLVDFFKRPGPWLILSFIFFYKFGDQLANSLNTAFLMDIGYTKKEIAGIVKGVGLVATMAGVGLGGLWTLRFGLKNALWVFGVLQMISILCFAALCRLPLHLAWLGTAICAEHVAAGAGTSAFVAFMGRMTNRRFSASQYALLSALMSLPRTLVASRAGVLVDFTGWFNFYFVCIAMALPGLCLLYFIGRRGLLAENYQIEQESRPPA